jgi:hypothetical protein
VGEKMFAKMSGEIGNCKKTKTSKQNKNKTAANLKKGQQIM